MEKFEESFVSYQELVEKNDPTVGIDSGGDTGDTSPSVFR